CLVRRESPAEYRSWSVLVTSGLLKPQGEHRSKTSLRDRARAGNVASPHTKNDGRVGPIAWRNTDNAGPAGSINSSVADMTQWVRMLLAGGELDGRRILDEATVRELQVPHTITEIGRASCRERE